MKKILQLLALVPALVFGQTNVQKGTGNVLSNGPIVVGSGNSITATGTGVIAATSIPSLSIATTPPLTGGGALSSSLTLAIPAATGSVNGYLTSADWTTFNSKDAVVTVSAPLVRTVNNIAIPAATGSVNGYLTSTDWTTFNGKQAAGNYITALTGDVTAAGPGSATATLASVISASTVGSSTAIPVLTYDAKGRLTSTTTAAVVAPAGTLTGTTLAANVVTSSLTTVGTIGTGAWQGTVVAGQYGGTGVANTGKTITLGGNLATSGAFASTFTMTGITTVTFPTSGTLATVAGTVSSITGTTNQVIASASTGAVTLSLPQDIATTSAVSFGSLSLGGTAGAGYLQLANQSSAPSTPTSSSRLYIDSSNRLSWIGTNGKVRTFDGTANTQDRIYVLPDAAGTVALVATTVPSIAGTAGNVLVNGGTTAVAGSAVTLSLPTALTSVNSVTSAAGTALTLATGTTGTALTISSATNLATFSAGLSNAGIASIANNATYSQAAWALVGGMSRHGANTTVTDSSSSGTVASVAMHSFSAGTLAASSATTYTDAAVLYVGTMNAGTNATFTNAYSFWSAGRSRFDSNITVGTSANVFMGFGRRLSWDTTVVASNASAYIGGDTGNVMTITGTGGIILDTRTSANPVTINNAIASTSTSTGALVLSGASAGLGVAGQITAGGEIQAVSASAGILHAKTTTTATNVYLRLETFNRNWYAGALDSGSDATFNISTSSALTSPVLSINPSTNLTTFAGSATIAGGVIELDGSVNAAKTIYLSAYGSAAATFNYIRSTTNGFDVSTPNSGVALRLQENGGATNVIGNFNVTATTGTNLFSSFVDINKNSGLRIRSGASDGFTFSQATTNTWIWDGLTGGSTMQVSSIFQSINATAGTSTTAAAILGKSMGLTENLYIGGNFFAINSSTTDVSVNLQRTAGTTSSWGIYLPSGSTELRFYNSGDKFRIQTSGSFISSGTLTTAAGVAYDFGAANTVSPTSPNRTLTTIVNGTTYYIAAKTTND